MVCRNLEQKRWKGQAKAYRPPKGHDSYQKSHNMKPKTTQKRWEELN